jgi:hypothetical protein
MVAQLRWNELGVKERMSLKKDVNPNDTENIKIVMMVYYFSQGTTKSLSLFVKDR